jgi:signal transduction histidine kinase/CheY-like chemotaxis protein
LKTGQRLTRGDGAAAPSLQGRPATARSEIKVLIVDDSPSNRKLLRVILQAEAYRVVEAEDGAAALAVLEREKIDAVISDILMPVMDGYRLCYEIRKKDPWKHLPFIAYSSTYTSHSDEQTALEFGADKFIRKPASPGVILQALREVVKKTRQRDAKDLLLPEELQVMRNYSEVLVRKLEERNLELNQANEEIKRNLDRIRALHEIDVAMASTLDLRAVLRALLEKIDLFIPYPSATTVRLLDQETGEIRSIAGRNIDEAEWQKRENKKVIGRAKLVLESRRPMVVCNVQTDPTTHNRDLFRALGLVSYLGVPLIAKDEALGVLSLYTAEEHDFSADDVEFMTTLAGQAALAIHNSQLYDRITKLASDLKTANSELRISNKAKSEFLSVMSHELRTPLSVVMGYTGMLLERQLGAISKKQETALGKVSRHSQELLTLINSIMEATKIEAGAVIVEQADVDPLNLLEEIKLAYDIPVDKQVQLVWNLPGKLPLIKTDNGKLRQILMSLIDNAIKFTDKGTVAITARIVENQKAAATDTGTPANAETPSLHRSITPGARGGAGPWMEFKVSDTGVGIPQEEIANVFQLFRQIDSSETRLYGGVGLGLYIVHSFAELLGGNVEVESRVGAGSAFAVKLPLDPSHSVGRPADPEAGR